MAETFSELAEQAQVLHSEREFAEAALTWELAATAAPDAMELARMQRGQGSSLWRVSQSVTSGQHALFERSVALLETALHTHDRAVEGAPNDAEALRERAETRAVLGRARLGEVIGFELDGKVGDPNVRQGGRDILWLLDKAKGDVTAAEKLTGTTDQHDINMLARLAMGHSLYGDLWKGATYAYEALAAGRHSESERVHLPAGLSLPYAGRAKTRAIVRGAAAVAVHTLALSPAPKARRAALRLTQRAL